LFVSPGVEISDPRMKEIIKFFINIVPPKGKSEFVASDLLQTIITTWWMYEFLRWDGD